MSHRRVTSLCAAIALYGVAASLGAQQPARAPESQPAAYALTGTVAGRDGTPIADAEVSLIDGVARPRLTRSDSSGKFGFSDVTAAEVTLRVRRLGYEPQALTVRLTKAGRTANVHVTLDRSSASLDAVVIDDDAPARPNPRLVAFNERAATNSLGHYLTEAMLAKLRPHHASEALRTVPGVILRPGRRIGQLVRLRGCGVRGESFERVGPLIWLDGVRLPGAEIDEVTQGLDIAAMEVYKSLAGVPPQYFDRSAVCGTILVWTKSG